MKFYSKGSSVTLSSEITTDGATYVWKKGSTVISGKTEKDLIISSFGASDVATYTVTATVDTTDTDTVFEVGMAELDLTPQPLQTITLEEGGSFTSTMTAVVKFTPDTAGDNKSDFTIKYQWKKGPINVSGATSAVLTKNNVVVADSGNYLVEVTLMDKTTSGQMISTRMVDLTVVTKVLESLWKVIPLEYRGTSFTWIGYWVIDEIKKNPSWFTDYSSLKYKDEIETIVKAFDEYGEVELQESRNGRILKVSDLK